MKTAESRLSKIRWLGAATSIAVAAVFTLTAIEPANAQGRKSIR